MLSKILLEKSSGLLPRFSWLQSTAVACTMQLFFSYPLKAECKIEDPSVPIAFYSEEGANIAACEHIPPPPIRLLQAKELDPPRTASASLWHAPFCQSWHDRKFQCRIDNIGHTECQPVTSNQENADYGIYCSRVVSDQVAVWGAYCRQMEKRTYVLYQNGSRSGMTEYSAATWTYDLSKSTPEWQYRLFEDFLSPIPPKNSGEVVSKEVNYSCRPYARDDGNEVIVGAKK